MSADVSGGLDPAAGEYRYEIRASADAVSLTIHRGGQEFSVSTHPHSALLLASDLLEAVEKTGDIDERGPDQFVFND